VQVVAGNRVPWGTDSRRFRIIGVHVVEGGEPVAKAEFLDGPGKDVDELLQAEQGALAAPKTRQAKVAILDTLEAPEARSNGIESDNLTTKIATQYRMSARTVKNAKTALKGDGLIKFVPQKDDSGRILQWRVHRTLADRPPALKNDK
jgi:hypothetical protein